MCGRFRGHTAWAEILAGPGETTWGCRDEEEAHTEPRGAPFRAWAEGSSRGGWKGVTAQPGTAWTQAACPEARAAVKTENMLLVWPLASRPELLKRLQFPK